MVDPSTIVDMLEEHLDPAAFFRACDERGLPLSQVVDLLLDPFEHLDADDAWNVEETVLYEWGSLSYSLVEALGVERAMAIERESKLLEDVVAQHDRFERYLAIKRLIADLVPLRRVAKRLLPKTSSREDGETDLPIMIARTYSLRELAVAWMDFAPQHREAMRRPIVGRVGPVAAYHELCELEPEVLRAAFATWWDIHVESGEADQVRLSLLAAALRQEVRPFNEVLRYADSEMTPQRWIPILRRCDLKGAQAALVLLEREMGIADVVSLLTTGGYDDDAVLTALLENGVGTRSSLEFLRAAGWSLSRMVESLHARDVLLPEVREQLTTLGVSVAAQRPLLLEHWEVEVVDLVLAHAPRMLPKA